ncbi:MAG: class II glutamine amidotransferase, partial [Plesiomonas shigelloides]
MKRKWLARNGVVGRAGPVWRRSCRGAGSLMYPVERKDTAAKSQGQERRPRMCELLGMSANVPTDICFSFTGLARRGGQTGPHKDGWGITFYEGRGFRT